MASFNQSMRSHVAGSMNDRPTQDTPSAVGFTVKRSALERQLEGRKRLDAACVLRLDRIIPDPNQPRKEFEPDALGQLAESLRSRGQLQPIRVRWDESADRYVVVVGERRFRAAIQAGLETIAAVVVSGDATPEDLFEDQLVENALRVDLSPVESAKAYRALLTSRGLSQRQLAERLQIGHASIARALALLELPEGIRAQVDAGEIAANVGYELSKISDPHEQERLASEAASGLLTRDDLTARTRTPRAVVKESAVGKTRNRKETSRVFRTSSARVAVELRRGDGIEAMISALEESLSQARKLIGASETRCA